MILPTAWVVTFTYHLQKVLPYALRALLSHHPPHPAVYMVAQKAHDGVVRAIPLGIKVMVDGPGQGNRAFPRCQHGIVRGASLGGVPVLGLTA